jgi:hypothetical protein
MKKSIKKKRELNRRGTTTTANSELAAANTIAPSSATVATRTRAVEIGRIRKASAAQNANEAERNVKIMIVVSGVNYFLGHVYMFISYCILIRPSVFRTCFFNITLVFFYTSYMTPFFIYFACNKLFRSYALGYKRDGSRVGSTTQSRRL